MLFYLYLIFYIIALYLLTRKIKNGNKVFLFCSFFLFFILIGFRDFNTGNDTYGYVNLFKDCSKYKFSMMNNKYYEKGYILLNILVSYISKSPRFFLVLLSFFVNFVVYYFIKKNSKNYFFSIIMYLCMLFFYSSATMLRQFLAIIVVLSAFKYVKERKIVKYILSIILATLFHATAYIALPIYFIYSLKYSKKTMAWIFISCLIAMLFVGPIIEMISDFIGKENYYASRVGSDSISNLIYTIIYFGMYFFSKYEVSRKHIKLDKTVTFYLYILFVTGALNMIATNMNILARAAEYYCVFCIAFFPTIISYIKIAFNKKITYIFLFCIFVMYGATIIYCKPEWNTAYNDYKLCILGGNQKSCK